MNSGVIFGISQDWRGDTLSVDAASTDLALQVNDACDFDEVFPTARYLVVGDETTPRQYTAADMENNTVTLATAVGGTGLEAGLPVVLWDPTVGTTGARSVEYIAKVELHDGSGAPDVTIPHEMIPAAGVFNLVGASVTIDEDDDGDLVIGEVLGRENVSDGTYVALDDGTTLEDIYSQANAAAAAAADAAANATTALTAANGKNKVTYSLSTPGATSNAAGDIWFQKDSATQTIIGQWIGGGGTTWVSTQLRNEVIANLDAGKLVAGSAFTNALSVKTNFTLGDAATNGVIQSYNFAGSSVGVYIDKNGLVAKGGSIAGAALTGVTITGSSSVTAGPTSGVHSQMDFGILGCYDGGTAMATLQSNGYGMVLNNFDAGSYTCDGTINAGGRITAAGGFTHGAGNTPPGSSGTANTYIDSNGLITKSTSSQRYKYDISDVDLDGDVVHQLQSRTFRRLDDPLYDPGAPDAAHQWIGLIAEEVAAVDPRLAVFDEQGRPDGIDWWVLLLHVVQALKDERAARVHDIEALTARVEQLEAK